MPTYERFLLAAELLEISPQELASRLEGRVSPRRSSPTVADDADSDAVPVHANYLGRRVEALFERLTNNVTVTSGSLAGTTYGSPSSAAIAVVMAINPEREAANTNGRLFWIVTSSGQPLRSLVGRR
jgi:hypothetical protein